MCYTNTNEPSQYDMIYGSIRIVVVLLANFGKTCIIYCIYSIIIDKRNINLFFTDFFFFFQPHFIVLAPFRKDIIL